MSVQVALQIQLLVDSQISRGCQVCLHEVPKEPQVQYKEQTLLLHIILFLDLKTARHASIIVP
jgi:hypothetical protein